MTLRVATRDSIARQYCVLPAAYYFKGEWVMVRVRSSEHAILSQEHSRNHVQERPNPRLRLSEAELSDLWLGQKFPPQALVLREGTSMQVVYRGRPAGGPGPDFRDAVIAYPDATLRKGDIELHVRASDFRAHGHHRDPAYNGLILHVVFENDAGPETLLPNGRTAPVVALGDWVARRAQQLESWLRRPPLWREPCHDAAQRLGTAEVASALDRLGLLRFRAKVAAFRKALDAAPADDVLYRALLRAVNFGGNEEAAEELATRLPWAGYAATVRSFASDARDGRAASLLVEAAGLAAGSRALMDGRRWLSWGMRPENRPARRLAGAALLLNQTLPRGPSAWALALVESATAPVSTGAGAPGQGWTKAASVLIDQLIVREEGRRAALIGPARAAEIAMNVILPYSAASVDTRLATSAETLARALPAPPPYGATRLVYQYLTDGSGRAIATTALRTQGLLHLSHHYCTQGGCGACPLS